MILKITISDTVCSLYIHVCILIRIQRNTLNAHIRYIMSTFKNDYAWDLIVTYRGSHVLYHNVLHVLFLDVDYQSNLHPNTINSIILWQTALKLTMPLVRKKITSYRQSCLPLNWRGYRQPFLMKVPQLFYHFLHLYTARLLFSQCDNINNET